MPPRLLRRATLADLDTIKALYRTDAEIADRETRGELRVDTHIERKLADPDVTLAVNDDGFVGLRLADGVLYWEVGSPAPATTIRALMREAAAGHRASTIVTAAAREGDRWDAIFRTFMARRVEDTRGTSGEVTGAQPVTFQTTVGAL